MPHVHTAPGHHDQTVSMYLSDEGESTDIRLYTEKELIAAKDEIESITYDIARHIFSEILPYWQPTPATDFKL